MPLLPLALAAALLQDSGDFALLATNSVAADMVSLTVTGPRDARALTVVTVLATPTRNGWNNVVADLLVDCGAGTVQYVRSRAFIDDTLASTRPAQPAAVPVANGLDAAVLNYACATRPVLRDDLYVTGIAAARAYGRRAMTR